VSAQTVSQSYIFDSFILHFFPLNNCSIFIVPDSPPNDGHLLAPTSGPSTAPKEEEESDEDVWDYNYDPDHEREWRDEYYIDDHGALWSLPHP
jgi:hypothetical protein